MSGKVYLVGAGPGDPELLTLKAVKFLKSADVVLHDELIGPDVLQFVSPHARVRSVGKRCGRASITQSEINTLLVNYARLDLQVVRLKGGDPLIFGRGGEEIEALRKAKIDFEIVPGVTTALGGAAAAQIPLTHRNSASALILLTGHSKTDQPPEWPANIPATATVVVYMPGYDYQDTVRNLVAAGVNPGTPCAILSNATTPRQETYCTTLDSLPNAPRLPSPTILVVGEVVRLARPLACATDVNIHEWETPEVMALFPPTHIPSADLFVTKSTQHAASKEQAE
jgi:uroporphyrin-III C-methyltransferase